MNNRYLIPANTKRSMLILGLFNKIDLVIFLVGVALTIMLMLVVGSDTPLAIGVNLAPLIISTIMVAPVPNHRNVWNFTVNVYTFFANQRKYRWRGWCMLHGEDEESK